MGDQRHILTVPWCQSLQIVFHIYSNECARLLFKVLTSRGRTKRLFTQNRKSCPAERLRPSQQSLAPKWKRSDCISHSRFCEDQRDDSGVLHSRLNPNNTWHTREVWWESAGSLQKKKPSPNKWIKRGSTPLIGPFRCLFGGHWYLMGPYRCRTALVHEPRYHTGPFPGAPTGRVGSQGSAEKGTFGKERKRTVDTRGFSSTLML